MVEKIEIDKEYLKNYSPTEIYCKILLEILNQASSIPLDQSHNCEEKMTKHLKFNNYKEVLQLRASIDNIEDTQYAINEFIKDGLAVSKIVSLGEKYLRLYGLLNAAYQQTNSLLRIAKLFNMQKNLPEIALVKNCRLIDIRSQIAAHTTDYVDNFSDKNNTDFYRIVQTSLDKWPIQLELVSYKKQFSSINLLQTTNEYISYQESLLNKICNKAIESVIKKTSIKDYLNGMLQYSENKS